MKLMKYYHNLYFNCHVLLLADVFENLIEYKNIKHYGIFQVHCLNAQALSWDAMLNMTKVELELQLLTCILKKV